MFSENNRKKIGSKKFVCGLTFLQLRNLQPNYYLHQQSRYSYIKYRSKLKLSSLCYSIVTAGNINYLPEELSLLICKKLSSFVFLNQWPSMIEFLSTLHTKLNDICNASIQVILHTMQFSNLCTGETDTTVPESWNTPPHFKVLVFQKHFGETDNFQLVPIPRDTLVLYQL